MDQLKQETFDEIILSKFEIYKFKIDIDKDRICQLNDEPTSFSLPVENFQVNLFRKNLIHFEDHDYFKIVLNKLKNGEDQVNCEARYLLKNLEYHIFKTVFVKQKNENVYICYTQDLEGNFETFVTNYKTDLNIVKSSLKIALEQASVNYFEFDLISRKLYLSSFAQRYFNLPSVLDGYPDCIINNPILYQDDRDIYREQLNKIINNEADSISMEIRLFVNSEFKWFRKYYTVIKDSNGKAVKAIGSVLPIDSEVKNKSEFSLAMNNLDVFNNHYIGYTIIDVDEYKLLRFNSNLLELESIAHNLDIETYLNLLKQELHPEDFDIFNLFIQQEYLIAHQGKNFVIRMRRLDKNQFSIWVETRFIFIRDPHTDHLVIMLRTYNINQEVEEKKLLRSLVQEENEVVLKADKKSEQILIFAKENNYFNLQAGMQILKPQEYDDMLGDCLKTVNIISSDTEIKSFAEAFGYLEPGIKYRFLFETKNNPTKLLRATMSYESKTETILVYVDDVTALVENEREINETLEKAINDAQLANYSKAEFFSRMSHDMRTPMTAILGMVDFALLESHDSHIDEYLKQIKSSSNHLLGLLNDILDLQKMERKVVSLNPKVVDYKSFIVNTANMISIKAKMKNIEFSYDIKENNSHQYLIFDEIRARQVFLNILNNAVKYTPNGGKIKWEIDSYFKEGKLFLKHTIQDTGIGMSKEFQEIMYNQFSREEREYNNGIEGSGLGLAITKNLVTSWNGKISCESSLNNGTKLIIEFPCLIANDNSISEFLNEKVRQYSDENLFEKKILVVEDVQINIKIITKLLEEKGMDITIVNNGLKAVEIAKEKDFDVILMDVKMPVMNGLEATKRIREFDKKVTIIALSANAYTEDINQCFNVGMNSHLSKPIDRFKLYETLSYYLGKKPD